MEGIHSTIYIASHNMLPAYMTKHLKANHSLATKEDLHSPANSNHGYMGDFRPLDGQSLDRVSILPTTGDTEGVSAPSQNNRVWMKTLQKETRRLHIIRKR